MSISGPSALGTLLVQRLDAVLGTTLSQQTNLASGARPDAISQPGQPLSLDPVQNQTARDARSTVDKALEQSGQQLRQTAAKTKLDAQQSILAARSQPATSSTPSAPTTLGSAARAILALLQNFPDRAPPVAGKSPLVSTEPQVARAQPATLAPGSQAASRTAAGATANQAAGSPGANIAPSGSQMSSNSTAGNAVGAATGGAPMAAAPNAAGTTAAQFVQALSQTLQNSGLFYESHLSNVAFGTREAASLHNEPQAHAGRNATPQPAGPASPSEAAPRSGGEAAQQSNASATATAPQTSAAPNTALAGLHPDTHLLVRQQLEVLANQTIVWRGEAWPNAPMQWEVLHENAASEYDDEASHWATRLTLNLPNLGEVQARINLSGQQIVMQLIAPESATLLNENSDTLRTHLLASGLQVSALSVHDKALSQDEPLQAPGLDPAAPEANS